MALLLPGAWCQRDIHTVQLKPPVNAITSRGQPIPWHCSPLQFGVALSTDKALVEGQIQACDSDAAMQKLLGVELSDKRGAERVCIQTEMVHRFAVEGQRFASYDIRLISTQAFSLRFDDLAQQFRFGRNAVDRTLNNTIYLAEMAAAGAGAREDVPNMLLWPRLITNDDGGELKIKRVPVAPGK